MSLANGEIDIKRVTTVLRSMGFEPCSRGNGTGHALWQRPDGKKVSVVLRKGNMIPIAFVHAMGREMESKGIVERREFCRRVQRGSQ